MVQWYSIHIPEHVTFRIFQKFLLEMGKQKTFSSCFYTLDKILFCIYPLRIHCDSYNILVYRDIISDLSLFMWSYLQKDSL